MAPFIMPADLNLEYPALHDQSTEMGANIALSQVQLQNFETQRIWETHHEPFSKSWWGTFCQQGACLFNQPPAFDLYHRRGRREAWHKRVIKTRKMDDYLSLVMDWSGHATSLLSLPPFVASTQRYVRFENVWPDANMDSIKLAEYRSPVELVPSSDEELDMTADESSLEFSYDDLFAFDRYYDEGVENDEQHRDDNAELGVAEGDHMTQMMDAEMMEAPILTPVLCHSSRGTDILEVPGVRSSSPTAQNREPPSCSRPVMADVDPHAAPIQNKLETFLPPASTTRNLVSPQPDHQLNRTITAARDSVGSF